MIWYPLTTIITRNDQFVLSQSNHLTFHCNKNIIWLATSISTNRTHLDTCNAHSNEKGKKSNKKKSVKYNFIYNKITFKQWVITKSIIQLSHSYYYTGTPQTSFHSVNINIYLKSVHCSTMREHNKIGIFKAGAGNGWQNGLSIPSGVTSLEVTSAEVSPLTQERDTYLSMQQSLPNRNNNLSSVLVSGLL